MAYNILYTVSVVKYFFGVFFTEGRRTWAVFSVTTDLVANYGTVVTKTEADDLAVIEKHMRSSSPDNGVGEIMKDHMGSVVSESRARVKT